METIWRSPFDSLTYDNLIARPHARESSMGVDHVVFALKRITKLVHHLWVHCRLIAQYRFTYWHIWECKCDRLRKHRDLILTSYNLGMSSPFQYATWNDNLDDLQLLRKRQNVGVDPLVKIACGVESVHNKPTYNFDISSPTSLKVEITIFNLHGLQFLSRWHNFGVNPMTNYYFLCEVEVLTIKPQIWHPTTLTSQTR